MLIQQGLVHGEKYSQRRGSREPHKNSSPANKSWYTVLELCLHLSHDFSEYCLRKELFNLRYGCDVMNFPHYW